ncbi:hypothetical protein Tco_0854409 [Tanacetum coccineum]
MINQVVQVMPPSEQSNVVNHSKTEITSDSNIIPYSQYVIGSQQVVVQNSNSSIQHDALILSVIELLKTLVVNCTKINLDNKSVNDTLTAELERSKEQVKVLKEGQNVDLRSNDNSSDTSAQFVEIYHLKQTLSENLKEKESLMQTVTLLKNDFKKEESRNINREIALENRIKQLDNIKAQQFKPKLYDGNVIKNMSAIVIPDSEETLILAEESRSKMLLKQKDPMMLEKKVNTKPVDYANYVNSLEPTLSSRPTKVEVPQELPKVSMVNMSLKKLKHHLASFDVVVKERTTATTITEGSWGSVEISDLNASLQKKVGNLQNSSKDDLRDVKIDVKMLKTDVEPIILIFLNKMTTHSAYIKHIHEEAAVLKDLVDHINANYPLDHTLDSPCRYTKLIQELLTNISKTCPSINNTDGKLVAVTPKNKNKRVRFTEPVTFSGHTITKTASTSNLVSNKPMLSSTGVKPSTSASGSQPSCNTKKDKIQPTSSSTQKNKVEAYSRKVKYSLKNKYCVVTPKGTANVQQSKLNANSELKCVKCNGCMLSDNHDLCVLDFINNVNARITTTTEVPPRKPTTLENETPKPVVTLVYSRKPRKFKTNVPVSKSKILKSVPANKKEPKQSWGSIVSDVPSSFLDECRSSKLFSVKLGNDHVAKILGYGDYQIGNVTISRVYYVEGHGHNLFSIGQFYDSNLKVAFRQHTCFIRNLERVDLLT